MGFPILELSAPRRIGDLRGGMRRRRDRGGGGGGGGESWSPWLSVEQNPSLIKGECRGDT